MIKLHGEKMTANQFAKTVVIRLGEGAWWWDEKYYAGEQMTEREKNLVNAAVNKQVIRVAKFLGQCG